MSGLAEILLNLGYDVSGSDLARSEITDRLVTYGLRFAEGHDAAHVGDAAVVVVSAAVPEENVELKYARERRLPVIHRSDLLAHLVRLKPNAVIVGGTHGKTTTTSMISAVLDHANIGATSIVGGILRRSGTNARWGTGDYLVAEADEHDGSFLRLHPTIAVVTNIDAEHLEFYGTIDKIRSAFIEFCNTVPFYGYSILCQDDANCRGIIGELDSVSVTYGLDEGAGLRGTNLRITQCARDKPKAAQLASLCTAIDVENRSEVLGPTGKLGTIEVNALGPDNARNALAACAVGLCLGMRFGAIAEGIRDFTGVQRRLQVVGETRGITIIEDYAHHPTEIRSTLAAVRQVEPGRVIIVFQPHLYSRTNYFSTEFAEALAGADLALVTDIYASREKPMPGVTSDIIVDAARDAGNTHVQLFKNKDEVAAYLAPKLRADDVVLFLGAGNINRVAPFLLAELEQR